MGRRDIRVIYHRLDGDVTCILFQCAATTRLKDMQGIVKEIDGAKVVMVQDEK